MRIWYCHLFHGRDWWGFIMGSYLNAILSWGTILISHALLLWKGWASWQICQFFGGAECLRYPDGSSVAQSLPKPLPSLIIARKWWSIWIQSINLQNFKKNAWIVTVFVKPVCYYISVTSWSLANAPSSHWLLNQLGLNNIQQYSGTRFLLSTR